MDFAMNDKVSLSASPRKNVTYTIKNPIIPAGNGMKRNAPPPIGPEIGPDPRSSIGARISMTEVPRIKDEKTTGDIE